MPEGEISLGRSPSQELDVDPHSGPYLQVNEEKQQCFICRYVIPPYIFPYVILVPIQAQALAGPGLGAFADVSLARVEASAGPVGVHLDLNVNTGIGARNGNVEAHVMGWGVKVGVDGFELDTPIFGAKCTLM